MIGSKKGNGRDRGGDSPSAILRRMKKAKSITATRTCPVCLTPFTIDAQEVADGTYSPLCTDCLRARSEGNERLAPDERERTTR